MRTKTKRGLRDSAFVRPGPDEPVQITAKDDSIELVVFFAGETSSRVVKLRPCHIEAIAAMKEDWWESRWAAVHEAEA